MFILSFSFAFYLSASNLIAQKGFEIPDSLIDASLSFMPENAILEGNEKESSTPQISIPPEQLEILKQNPDLLKQYGITPEMLNEVENPTSKSQKTNTSLTNNLIKATLKQQFKTMLEPYLTIIAPLLSAILFLSLQSLTSLLFIFLSAILMVIFYILEKSGFITYEKEMREVKKMVV